MQKVLFGSVKIKRSQGRRRRGRGDSIKTGLKALGYEGAF